MKPALSTLRTQKEMESIQVRDGDAIRADYCTDGSAEIHYSMHLDDGVYAGHTYEFVIKVPSSYPFAPPKAVALSKVFHPSIDALGRVCMNITREDWSITQGIQSVVFGLSTIFHDVPTEEPLNQEAHALLTADPAAFAKEAQRVYRSNRPE